MIQPTRRAVSVGFAGLAVALLPAIFPALWPLWALYLLAFLLAMGLELVLGMSADQLELTIAAPAAIMLGEPGELVITGVAPRRRISAT